MTLPPATAFSRSRVNTAPARPYLVWFAKRITSASSSAWLSPWKSSGILPFHPWLMNWGLRTNLPLKLETIIFHPPQSSGGEEVRGWRCFFETCWNPCSYPHKNRVPCPSSIQFLCFWTVLGWIFPTWISNVDHITRQILNRLDPSRFFHIQNDPTKWLLIFK